MEQTTQGIDARAYLIGWMKAMNGMFIADINALPDDVLCASQGGVSRPANELAADTILLLGWTADALNGNVRPSYGEGGSKELGAQLTTKSAIAAAMSDAVDNLASAIAGASDETMSQTVLPPWQMEAPLFMIATIAANHIWYHDGQLNYIQALNGDGEVHWM